MDHKDPSPGCDLPVASLADAGYSLSGCHVDVCCRPGGRWRRRTHHIGQGNQQIKADRNLNVTHTVAVVSDIFFLGVW